MDLAFPGPDRPPWAIVLPLVASPPPAPAPRLALALFGALLGAACGLSEVFTPAGAGAVVFVWESDSVLSDGQVVPIRITVLADGEPLVQPRLSITVPDTTNIALDASGDSLVGRKAGRGDVLVELRSSLTTGIPPDTVFSIRVTGAPPP